MYKNEATITAHPAKLCKHHNNSIMTLISVNVMSHVHITCSECRLTSSGSKDNISSKNVQCCLWPPNLPATHSQI